MKPFWWVGHKVNAWELTLELKVGMGEMYSACMNQQNKNRTPPSGRARIDSNLLLRDPLLLLHNLLPHRSWIWIIQRQLSKALNIHSIRTFHFLITRYYTLTASFLGVINILISSAKIDFCHPHQILSFLIWLYFLKIYVETVNSQYSYSYEFTQSLKTDRLERSLIAACSFLIISIKYQ